MRVNRADTTAPSVRKLQDSDLVQILWSFLGVPDICDCDRIFTMTGSVTQYLTQGREVGPTLDRGVFFCEV